MNLRALHFVLQLLVAQVPSFLSGITVQMTGVVKVSLQLQVAPMIQLVADQLRHGLSPLLEFLTVGSISGDVFLINAVRTHLTPFVMVAAQPYLGDVLELTILSDFSWIDMAVIVQTPVA